MQSEATGVFDDGDADAPDDSKRSWGEVLWPWFGLLAVVAIAVCQLHHQGRFWWCACGEFRVWTGDIGSSHNSQHLFDPYSLTHVLHGVLLCGLITWICPRLPQRWRFCVAISLESFWEVFENTEFVIQRYRTLAIAAGYQGDTIINSLGDILSCGIGFALAARLGFGASVALFFAIEFLLLLWINDSLLLSAAMLLLGG